MVMRTVQIVGVEIADANWTVLWDGATVASGAVVAGAFDDEAGAQVLGSWTFEDNGSAELTEHSLSITVNSGIIKAGPLSVSTPGINSENAAEGSPYISVATDVVGVGSWMPSIFYPFGDGSDTALADRSAILVNGVAPVLEPGQTTTGTEANPTWQGWHFFVGAGDEFTCTGRCPAQWVAA
jgi:hypothetical protein